jgi:ankyrin repeat protein
LPGIAGTMHGNCKDPPIPLFVAIRSNDTAEVSKLLNADVDPNCVGTAPNSWRPDKQLTSLRDGGETVCNPITLAAICNRPECVRLLLAHGADPSQPASDGVGTVEMPLYVAAAYGCAEVIELLLKNGAPIDAKNIDGEDYTADGQVFWTAFHAACYFGKLDCADMLVRAGCDQSALTASGQTGYQLAKQGGYTGLMRRLRFLSRVKPTISGPALKTANGGAEIEEAVPDLAEATRKARAAEEELLAMEAAPLSQTGKKKKRHKKKQPLPELDAQVAQPELEKRKRQLQPELQPGPELQPEPATRGSGVIRRCGHSGDRRPPGARVRDDVLIPHHGPVTSREDNPLESLLSVNSMSEAQAQAARTSAPGLDDTEIVKKFITDKLVHLINSGAITHDGGREFQANLIRRRGQASAWVEQDGNGTIGEEGPRSQRRNELCLIEYIESCWGKLMARRSFAVVTMGHEVAAQPQIDAILHSPRWPRHDHATSSEDERLQMLLSISDATPDQGQAMRLIRGALSHMVDPATVDTPTAITKDSAPAFHANLICKMAWKGADRHEIELLKFIESTFIDLFSAQSTALLRGQETTGMSAVVASVLEGTIESMESTALERNICAETELQPESEWQPEPELQPEQKRHGGYPLHAAIEAISGVHTNADLEAYEYRIPEKPEVSCNVANLSKLLHDGADPNHIHVGWTEKYKFMEHTPLTLATTLNQLQTVQILLEYGADASKPVAGGASAMPWAAFSEAQMTTGAHRTAHGTRFRLPLQYAALCNRADIAQLLLDKGAAVDAICPDDVKQPTAFHYACGRGFSDTVDGLVRAGCDRTAKTRDGKTGYQIAKSAGHTGLLCRLRRLDRGTHLHYEGHASMANAEPEPQPPQDRREAEQRARAAEAELLAMDATPPVKKKRRRRRKKKAQQQPAPAPESRPESELELELPPASQPEPEPAPQPLTVEVPAEAASASAAGPMAGFGEAEVQRWLGTVDGLTAEQLGAVRAQPREKQIGGSGGSLEPPGPLS